VWGAWSSGGGARPVRDARPVDGAGHNPISLTAHSSRTFLADTCGECFVFLAAVMPGLSDLEVSQSSRDYCLAESDDVFLVCLRLHLNSLRYM
jgi:hypothetical protein